jgi:MamI restriction endonuclease
MRASQASCWNAKEMTDSNMVVRVLELLDLHYDTFHAVAPYARETGHPVPTDTRGWSQIIVSVLTETEGLKRKKGADLDDGSDVKGANTWEAIDTPRFNGVIKSGTRAEVSGTIASLDRMPFLYLVLWDDTKRGTARCRIWVVRPQHDTLFREMCAAWYEKRAIGEIKSDNFQLHPPRGLDTSTIRNTCGNLAYPLYFCAERSIDGRYEVVSFEPAVRDYGTCTQVI